MLELNLPQIALRRLNGPADRPSRNGPWETRHRVRPQLDPARGTLLPACATLLMDRFQRGIPTGPPALFLKRKIGQVRERLG